MRPADRVIVPKSGLRLVQHHALYLGKDQFGQDIMAENKIGLGVRLVTADLFFQDVIEITEVKKFYGSDAVRKVVVLKSLQMVGQPYDLILYNCQHFANEMQDGIIHSPQVNKINKVIGFAAISLLILGTLNTIFD